jgi:uncharacterized Ntn-hydrolase superfamily protein
MISAKNIFLYMLLPTILLNNNIIGQELEKEVYTHTFSIVAYDPLTGDMGVAVQSHWFAVGKTVSWGEAGTGVIATQALVNFNFGPDGLKLLAEGLPAQATLDSLLKMDPGREMRQLAVLDKYGNVAVHTGSTCVKAAGHKKGQNYSVQANFATSPEVWEAMGSAFENTYGTLADKMIAALDAAHKKGGDIRGKQSASLLVVRDKSYQKPWIDRIVDLNVDDHENPIEELKRLYRVHLAYKAFNQGNQALIKGNLSDADHFFKKGQMLNPDNVEMTFWYAIELTNMGHLDKALPIFKTIFEKDITWKTIVLPRVAEAGILRTGTEQIEKINNL